MNSISFFRSGTAAMMLVARCPRAGALADRLSVPTMIIGGAVLVGLMSATMSLQAGLLATLGLAVLSVAGGSNAVDVGSIVTDPRGRRHG